MTHQMFYVRHADSPDPVLVTVSQTEDGAWTTAKAHTRRRTARAAVTAYAAANEWAVEEIYPWNVAPPRAQLVATALDAAQRSLDAAQRSLDDTRRVYANSTDVASALDAVTRRLRTDLRALEWTPLRAR
jgi:hypothetical protein